MSASAGASRPTATRARSDGPQVDAELTASQIADQLAGARVLVGSDAGPCSRRGWPALGQVPGLDAIVLAGLPTAYAGLPAAQAVQAGPTAGSDGELDRRPDPTARRRRRSPRLRLEPLRLGSRLTGIAV